MFPGAEGKARIERQRDQPRLARPGVMGAADKEALPDALRRKRGLSACKPTFSLRGRPLQRGLEAARKRGKQQCAPKRRVVTRGVAHSLHSPYPPLFVGEEECSGLARRAECGLVGIERRFGNVGENRFDRASLPPPGQGHDRAARRLNCRCPDIARAQRPDPDEQAGAAHHGLVELPEVTVPEPLAPVAD